MVYWMTIFALNIYFGKAIIALSCKPEVTYSCQSF